MDWAFLNEYTVLYVFCAGIVTQSQLVLRSFNQRVWAAIVMIICLVPAWYLPNPGDRNFAMPLCWAFFYSILFSIVSRKQILPVVTALVLLLYTELLYYALYLWAGYSRVEIPVSVVVAGMFPGILVALVSLTGMLRYKILRVLCYAWYFVALCLMIACQWSVGDLALLYAEGGFSLDLFIYVFFGGGVLLVFISNLVQLFLLLPEPTRPTRRIVLDAVTGPLTHHKNQANRMANRFFGREIDRAGWILIVTYMIFLIANAKFGLIPHGIIINLSILGIVWFVMPREIARFTEKSNREIEQHV
ncbi:MAG: hypothetical protein HN366_09470 [Deltaproteobacteria bacterium]|jgi:hypothetical protein|nr:hypothetical protein [Deltaproteobacteria bacterium]